MTQLPSWFDKALSAKHGLWNATPEERVAYYRHACYSFEIQIGTVPFQWYDVPARIDEAYSIEIDPEEITFLKPRRLELYANASFVDQVAAKHQMSIEHIAVEEDPPGVWCCQVRVSLPNWPASTGYNGFWISGSRREAMTNAQHQAVTKVAFDVSNGSEYMEHESATLLVPGTRRVIMDMDTGVVIAKQSIPSIAEELRGLVESEGLYTWDQFQAMIRDMSLDVIEGDIGAAQWDAYVLLSTVGEVDAIQGYTT